MSAEEAARRHAKLDALASELAELAKKAPGRLAERVEELTLREQADLALRLPSRERLELLLHAEKPLALVRALPDFEVYLTVRDVGPADAMPLLSLASGGQLQHLLDLEGWRGDRFDGDRCGAWVALLLESGEPTIRRFLNTADDELLTLLFQGWVRATAIDIDHEEPTKGHGETEAGDERGFVSPDGNWRFSPSIPEHAPAVRRFAELFYRSQQERYLRILWDAANTLPSEVEEGELHWRVSRLEEHGFPGLDDALTIYAPPAGKAIPPGEPLPPPVEGSIGAARSLILRHEARGLVAEATDALEGGARETALSGLVALANRVLVAEGWDAGDPAAHRRAAERVAGLVGAALEYRGAAGFEEAARVLASDATIELFREGFGKVSALRDRVRRMLREGFASKHARGIELVEGPLRARLRGLALDRPLHFDPELPETREPYREFASRAEIEEAKAAIDLAEAAGRLLVDGLGFPVAAVEDGATFSTLLSTALAWHAVDGEARGEGLLADVASEFLRRFASKRTAEPGAVGGAMDAFLGELREIGTLPAADVPAITVFARACVDRIEAECGGLDPAVPVTPLTVGCLWLARG